VGKERDGSDERVDDGKPWEIAWGELRWKGAIRKRRQGGESSVGKERYGSGKERYGSDNRVDGGDAWEIALGELRGEGVMRKRRQGGRTGIVGNSLWRAPLRRNDTEATQGGRMGGQMGNHGK